MKNELIQRLAADLAISTKTVKSKFEKLLDQIQQKDAFIAEAVTDAELYRQIALEIKSDTQRHTDRVNLKNFPYIIPTTEIFTKLFDLQYLKAKRENNFEWFAYWQSEDGKQKFSFQIPEQDIVEAELSGKIQNPFYNPNFKLFYIGLCSVYGCFESGQKNISVENLYRMIYSPARNINKDSLQTFIQQMDEFLKICKSFNNSFTCYYYGKKQTLDFNGILSFTISRDGLTINDVPSLLRHARSRKRIAGVNRQLVSSGKAESMLQRLYIAYRMTLAKNQNNRMSANIESNSIQNWCGCAASEKVVKKSFILLQQQKQISKYSISKNKLGFKIEVEV